MKEIVVYLILTLSDGTQTQLELDRTQPSMEECEKNIPIFNSYIAEKGYGTMTEVDPTLVAKSDIVCVEEDAKVVPTE